jgi:hypothetical protein
MKTNHLTRAALIAALLTASNTASAQEPVYPHTMPVSGSLTDGEGKPLEGSHKIELHLCDSARGDTLYAEEFEVDGPLLSVLLGKNTRPLEAKASLKELIQRGEATHLEIIIDGEVMTPRIALGSVPYALAADRANLAMRAVEAGNASSVNGKTASDFLPATYEPTYAQLADKPTFLANAPLGLESQGTTHVFGLAPCAAPDQVLAWGAGSWGCRPFPAPLTGAGPIEVTAGGVIQLRDDSIEAKHIEGGQIVSDKIAQNALTNDHVADGALSPSKITGGVLTLISATAQTVMGVLTVEPGRVTVGGALLANSFQTRAPIQRTYRVWADQFSSVAVNNGGTMALNENNQFYLSASPAVATYRAMLIASLPQLPGDAVLQAAQCFYTQEAGSLVGTSFQLVRTPSSGLASTQIQDAVTLASSATSPDIRVSTIGPNLNRPLYPNRLHLRVDWRPSLIGQWAKFLGCEVTITTTDPF